MALSDYKRSVSLHWCPTRLGVCLYKADVVNSPEGVNVEAVGEVWKKVVLSHIELLRWHFRLTSLSG